MFNEITKELDDLIARIEEKYQEINTIRKISDNCPSAWIEDTGKLLGIEEAVSEIVSTRIIIDDKIQSMLENSIDGQYSAKLKLLEDEIIVLKNKLHIKDKELKTYIKLDKDNSNKVTKIKNNIRKNKENKDGNI